MRAAILFIFFTTILFCAELRPSVNVKLSSPAVDMVFRGGLLYAACGNGDILTIDKNGKTVSKQKLPHKALSIDALGDTVAVAAQDGFIYIIQNSKIQKTLIKNDSVVRKLFFLDKNRVLAGSVNSEITLYDIVNGRKIFTVQVDTSPLSDMALSPDKSSVAVVGEAGQVYIMDTANGKKRAVLKGGNVDNIYKADWQNGYIITAGQDRRAVVYNLSGAIKARFEASFLIYAAALSPSARTAAMAMDEQNVISIFDTATQNRLHTAKGHNATLNRIVFMDENSFASAADENKILIWRIK